MKANDLMVGDFIRTKHTQKIVKVREIKQSCIYTIDNGYEYNEIEPIPLTPEILENNGFFIDTYQDGYEKNWVRGDFVFGINGFTSVGRNNFKIEYLHQLQHALRLCGIEKEIIL